MLFACQVYIYIYNNSGCQRRGLGWPNLVHVDEDDERPHGQEEKVASYQIETKIFLYSYQVPTLVWGGLAQHSCQIQLPVLPTAKKDLEILHTPTHTTKTLCSRAKQTSYISSGVQDIKKDKTFPTDHRPPTKKKKKTFKISTMHLRRRRRRRKSLSKLKSKRQRKTQINIQHLQNPQLGWGQRDACSCVQAHKKYPDSMT